MIAYIDDLGEMQKHSMLHAARTENTRNQTIEKQPLAIVLMPINARWVGLFMSVGLLKKKIRLYKFLA